jgi:hypothetical protein
VKKQHPDPIRILIAPLDWGLGHATRCIPLIRHFLERGCDVWIAAEGKTKQVLQQEFPELTFLDLKGYRIRYARTKTGLVLRMLTQIPSICRTIYRERLWLQKTVLRFDIDAVVSDNRFGMVHPSIPCVYITHQLRIQIPGGSLVESFVQRLHYRFINRFTACWVPDAENQPNLSGVLAHPRRLPSIPVHYLGPLSRLEREDLSLDNPLLILLSGPEPQRTLLEGLILRQLETLAITAVLVRGLPGANGGSGALSGSSPMEPGASDGALQRLLVSRRLAVHDHLPAHLLEQTIARSQWVIARTGYTTVMDLVKLQKKSILVPTPGQTEQEYLATYLKAEGVCYTVSQSDFSLERVLAEAEVFPYRIPFPIRSDLYKDVVDAWLQSLWDSRDSR